MKRTMKFETAIKNLEEIVDKLENGEETLQDSLKLFEEGTQIASFCYETLKNAEQKIIELSISDKTESLKDGDFANE